jgi:hypothetical protein
LGTAAADPRGRQVQAASRASHSAGLLASLARNIHWNIFGHAAVERLFAQDVYKARGLFDGNRQPAGEKSCRDGVEHTVRLRKSAQRFDILSGP